MEGNNQNLEQRVVLSNRKIFMGLCVLLSSILISTVLLSESAHSQAAKPPDYEFKDASDKALELFRSPAPPKEPKAEPQEEPEANLAEGELNDLPLLSYRLDNFREESEQQETQGSAEPLPAPQPVRTVSPEQERERQLLEQALKAPAAVSLDFTEAKNLPAVKDNPGSREAGKPQDGQSSGQLSALSQFENRAYINEHEVEEVRSPYVLMQGSLIPAVLITGIRSELPGQISAQVTTDIYDSLTGEHLLVPSGSRLIGQYASEVQMGTERIFSGFSRLILPDGRSLNLGAMPGQGLDGYSGLEAEVDNHYARIFLDSFLLAGFATAEAIVSRDVYDEHGKPRPTALMAQQFETQIGQASTRLLERHLNLAPTLSLKPGTMFNIAVVKDLYFKGDYEE
ncbi:MAG: hypothetical protein K6F05_06150 [Succinivibrio sp.]|nr:hypothetical protein [Succinivibrio sp.]